MAPSVPIPAAFRFLVDHCNNYPTLGKATQGFSHDSVGDIDRSENRSAPIHDVLTAHPVIDQAPSGQGILLKARIQLPSADDPIALDTIQGFVKA